jgi:hypothetical protein
LLERCGFERIHVRQYAIPPRDIALRGPLAERIGKKVFHYPNYFLTNVFGIFGDRLEVIAYKPHE